MGTNSLTEIGIVSAVDSTGAHIDQYRTALSGDFVPRNASGVPTDGAGNNGTATYQWKNIYLKNNLYRNGQLLDLGQLAASAGFQIVSGEDNADGFPDFLQAPGSTTTCIIAADADDLVMVINSTDVTVTADITVSSLTLAPSTNNTCAVDNTTLADQNYTKFIGEYDDDSLTIDTIGTEISSLDGTIQAFKHGAGAEFFLAYVDTTNNKLWPIKRGIGGTAREVLSNNDVITLMKINAIFLGSDGSTTYKTVTHPSWGDTDPGSATSGDWHFNTTTRIWKKYNGSAWEQVDAVYLGLAICDETYNQKVEPEDFDISWNGEALGNLTYLSASTIRVNLKKISVKGITHVPNDMGKIITMGTDMESGISEASDTTFYIYVDKNMDIFFSSIRPRRSDKKNASYHPYKYYRYIGSVYNDTSSDIGAFLKTNIEERWQDVVVFDNIASEQLAEVVNSAATTIINTTFTKTEKDKLVRFVFSAWTTGISTTNPKTMTFTVGSDSRSYSLCETAGDLGHVNMEDWFDISGQANGIISISIVSGKSVGSTSNCSGAIFRNKTWT